MVRPNDRSLDSVQQRQGQVAISRKMEEIKIKEFFSLTGAFNFEPGSTTRAAE
jgi:hypothetical protein